MTDEPEGSQVWRESRRQSVRFVFSGLWSAEWLSCAFLPSLRYQEHADWDSPLARYMWGPPCLSASIPALSGLGENNTPAVCQGDICRCHLGLTLSTHTSLVRSIQKCFQLIVLGRNRSILSLLEHSSARKGTQAWEQLWKMEILEWSWVKDDPTQCFQYTAAEHSHPWDLRLPELLSSQESSICWAPLWWYQTSRGYREGLCHPCLPNPHKLTEDALTAGKCLLINQPFFYFPLKIFVSFPHQKSKICSGSSFN